MGTVAYVLLPHDAPIDGTPVFTNNPNIKNKCWAVAAEETYFLMWDGDYITDYEEYENAEHMIVEGNIEIVNNTYVIHVSSVSTSG